MSIPTDPYQTTSLTFHSSKDSQTWIFLASTRPTKESMFCDVPQEFAKIGRWNAPDDAVVAYP
jgi:hypothetical protein